MFRFTVQNGPKLVIQKKAFLVQLCDLSEIRPHYHFFVDKFLKISLIDISYFFLSWSPKNPL